MLVGLGPPRIVSSSLKLRLTFREIVNDHVLRNPSTTGSPLLETNYLGLVNSGRGIRTLKGTVSLAVTTYV